MNIITVKNIKKRFKKRGGHDLLVLDNVNFSVKEGEIIALLGKSGSGKSTLLRIIAGLIQPTAGEVFYREEKIDRPIPGLTMVFQHFALLPWLTVLENVELGLEAQGIPKEQRRQRSLEAIDIVGLDGFESAYPKELSGGMCQRVGMARALVVEPEVILMDEPFSALDVLTAENLRQDMIDIFQSKKTNIKAVILVTHNIEEAVTMADRVLLFATNPGFIKSELEINIPQPRTDFEARVSAKVDEVYTLMTQAQGVGSKTRAMTMGYRLPKVEIAELTGFLNTLASQEYQGKGDLPELAEELHLDVDDLFPITEALEILKFASVSQGDINLSNEGKLLAEGDIQEKKQIFAKHLLQNIPLAKHIRDVLERRGNHAVSEDYFLGQLEDYLSEGAAEDVLTTVIDWGRYAEIFAYDYDTGLLSLENPE